MKANTWHKYKSMLNSANLMNIDKRVRWKNELSHKRLEKIGIVAGMALFAASCFSYFVIDAFG